MERSGWSHQIGYSRYTRSIPKPNFMQRGRHLQISGHRVSRFRLKYSPWLVAMVFCHFHPSQSTLLYWTTATCSTPSVHCCREILDKILNHSMQFPYRIAAKWSGVFLSTVWHRRLHSSACNNYKNFKIHICLVRYKDTHLQTVYMSTQCRNMYGSVPSRCLPMHVCPTNW